MKLLLLQNKIVVIATTLSQALLGIHVADLDAMMAGEYTTTNFKTSATYGFSTFVISEVLRYDLCAQHRSARISQLHRQKILLWMGVRSARACPASDGALFISAVSACVLRVRLMVNFVCIL